MYKETNKKIYTTTDYDMFKILDGNRSVKNARVVKTVESIEKHGWLTQPILVNEKFEVIDGQGRLEALKRLEMPVEFVIDEGIGIEECRTLNVYQKNWGLMDYVESFANCGNDNYIWLEALIRKYKGLPHSLIFTVAGDAAPFSNNGNDIKNGEFIAPKNRREYSDMKLFFLSRFVDITKHLKGRMEPFYAALAFLYDIEFINNERLYESINVSRYDLVAANSIEGCLRMIEPMYNKNLAKKNQVDMVHEYKIA